MLLISVYKTVPVPVSKYKLLFDKERYALGPCKFKIGLLNSLIRYSLFCFDFFVVVSINLKFVSKLLSAARITFFAIPLKSLGKMFFISLVKLFFHDKL